MLTKDICACLLKDTALFSLPIPLRLTGPGVQIPASGFVCCQFVFPRSRVGDTLFPTGGHIGAANRLGLAEFGGIASLTVENAERRRHRLRRPTFAAAGQDVPAGCWRTLQVFPARGALRSRACATLQRHGYPGREFIGGYKCNCRPR